MFLFNLLVIIVKLRAVFIKVKLLHIIKSVSEFHNPDENFYHGFPVSPNTFLFLVLLNEVLPAINGCWQ